MGDKVIIRHELEWKQNERRTSRVGKVEKLSLSQTLSLKTWWQPGRKIDLF